MRSLMRFYRPPKKRKKSYSQEKDQLFGNKKRLPCAYCRELITRDEATLDHIKPLSSGGYNRLKNYAVSCQSCNQKKGSMTREQFLNLLSHANPS